MIRMSPPRLEHLRRLTDSKGLMHAARAIAPIGSALRIGGERRCAALMRSGERARAGPRWFRWRGSTLNSSHADGGMRRACITASMS
jgi:hypothetical protein